MKNHYKGNRGASLSEYCLLLAVVCVTVGPATRHLGASTDSIFGRLAFEINGSAGDGSGAANASASQNNNDSNAGGGHANSAYGGGGHANSARGGGGEGTGDPGPRENSEDGSSQEDGGNIEE